MNNNFIISAYRFHTKEKNKLLIVCYFEEDLIGENKLAVQLDQKNIECFWEEKERMLTNTISELFF